jgi:hypothetical protein
LVDGEVEVEFARERADQVKRPRELTVQDEAALAGDGIVWAPGSGCLRGAGEVALEDGVEGPGQIEDPVEVEGAGQVARTIRLQGVGGRAAVVQGTLAIAEECRSQVEGKDTDAGEVRAEEAIAREPAGEATGAGSGTAKDLGEGASVVTAAGVHEGQGTAKGQGAVTDEVERAGEVE